MKVNKASFTLILVLFLLGAQAFAQGDSIFADFCFYNSSELNPGESGISLHAYKKYNSFKVDISAAGSGYGTYFTISIPAIEKKVTLLQGLEYMSGGGSLCTKHVTSLKEDGKLECRTVPGDCAATPRESSFEIFERPLIDFNSEDSLKLKQFYGKTLPLHWEYHYNMNPQKQKIVGDYIIYISGACTKEQIKAIKESLKANKEN